MASPLKKAVLALLCVVLMADTAAAQRRTPHSAFPTKRMLDQFGLHRAWASQATLNRSGDRVRHLVTDEEVTYVQSRAGIVTAFDNQTGKRLWARLLGRSERPSFPATSNDEAAFIAVDITLFAIEKRTGNELWTFQLKKHPSSGPATDGDQIFIGAIDGNIYAYDLRRIHALHKEDRLPEWSYQALAWQYRTTGVMTSPAVASGRAVTFASRDGSLYSLALPTSREKQSLLAVDKDRLSGSLLTIPKPTLRFQFETDDRIVAPIALANGRIYMATQSLGGSRVYCVDVNSGKLRWAVPTGFPVYHKPQVINDQLFVATSHGGMYCLSAETGMEIWRNSKSIEFLAATPNVVFASDVVNNIVLLNREDGTPMGKLPLRNFSVRIENDRTDRVIISTESGLVACIHEKGREFPLYHMHPDRKPIVPEFAAALPAAPEPADDSDDADSQNGDATE